MEKTEKNPETVQEKAHGLVHDAAYSIRIGELETAQAQLKEVDELLHLIC